MVNYSFVENVNKEEFNNFAIINKDKIKTHFLGSYEWGELSEKRNWIPYYVGVKKDGELVATAVLLKRNLVFGYTYVYCPRGFSLDYTNLDLVEYITRGIKEFCINQRALFFRIDPDLKLHTIDLNGNILEGESNESLVDYLKSIGYLHKPLTYAFEGEQPRFTFRTNISGSMEEIMNRYSKTTIHEIRKSRECSVIAYKGQREDIKEFIRLMKMTEARQDFYSHEAEYYYTFYDLLSKSGMADIYIGKVDISKLKERTEKELKDNKALMNDLENRTGKKKEKLSKEINNRIVALERKKQELEHIQSGEVIASAYIVVKYLDKFWTLYGANDMAYSKYYVNYAVYQKMIEDANSLGYKIFDGFGTVGRIDVNSNATGLFEFKKKWGGELTEFIGEFDYVINKPIYFAYTNLIPLYHRIKLKHLKGKDRKTQSENNT